VSFDSGRTLRTNLKTNSALFSGTDLRFSNVRDDIIIIIETIASLRFSQRQSNYYYRRRRKNAVVVITTAEFGFGRADRASPHPTHPRTRYTLARNTERIVKQTRRLRAVCYRKVGPKM